MRNINQLNGVTELTPKELLTIDGGTDKETSFWQDAAYIAGAILHGFQIFATEGGRNARISVH